MEMGTAGDDKGTAGTMQVIAKTKAALRKEDKVRIKIMSTETQRDDVPVGVNGHTYLIKRDEPVEVPLSVLEVLDHATYTAYTQVKRESGEGYDLVGREILRFPYVRVN